MDSERIISILSTVPKEILINCAKNIHQKNKKINTLDTKIKIENIPSVMSSKPIVKPIVKPTTAKRSGTKNVMLAHVYNPDKHEKKVANWWMSIKYDGVRGKWTGYNMESRTALVYSLPDFITEQLQKITDEDGNPMELDGEIWFGNDTFAIASGAARRYENDPELWKQMTYMVFDTPDTEMIFEDRIKKVAAALKRAQPLPNIKGVKHQKFDPSKTSIPEELTKIEETGGEGLVLRKPESLYVFAKSNDMLKVKSWSYKDAIVTGFVEGDGKYTGVVGSLEVKSNEFGDEDENEDEKKWVSFKVGSGLNDWQRYSGNPTGNWKSKPVQEKINEARKLLVKDIDKDNETYKKLVYKINNATGKERSDALHAMNDIFIQMPIISTKICFRFRELTKLGNPSMPTFVCCRDDYEHE
jgi:DNA ligase-1